MRILFLIALLPVQALAQAFSEPPALVRLVRTPAPDPAISARYRQAGAMSMIGMSAVTGPAEWWLMEMHASFAGLEGTERALRPMGRLSGPAGEPVNGLAAPAGSWLAVYRPWLSYRPTEASRMLASARYFQVLVFRVAPAAEPEFVEAVRARKASLDHLNLDRPEMAYQVISGAPTITYVFMAPLVSLTSFEEVLAQLPQDVRAVTKSAAAGNLSHENLLFRIEPGMSVVPAEFVQADPQFWRPGQR